MSSPTQQWQDCETGVLRGMVDRQQAADQSVTRRRAMRAIAVTGIGCLGAFLFSKSQAKRSLPSTQIACSKVHKNLQDFVDDKIADRYFRGVVSRHLFVCVACQEAYRGMIDGSEFECGAQQQA